MLSALKPVTLAGAAPMPPVVLLHGFLGDAEDWRPVAEALGDRHHVLAVNLPGHGPDWSRVAVSAVDMAACAAGLVAQFQDLGLAQVALVGYSMGGRIALYLARQYPERVGRLVMESASPGIQDEEQRALRARQDGELATRLDAMEAGSRAFRTFLEDWYSQPLFASLQSHPDRRTFLIEQRLARCTPSLLAAALRGLGTGSQPSLWDELHAFRTPTLIVAGELDRKFRIIAEDMALACPAVASEILTGCGHNVHLENSAAFVTIVRAFLNPACPDGTA
jgi:2-succinyl-6-hydroxy-2,4-cyclohexadiene-1-carboxylate synthase